MHSPREGPGESCIDPPQGDGHDGGLVIFLLLDGGHEPNPVPCAELSFSQEYNHTACSLYRPPFPKFSIFEQEVSARTLT